MTKLPKSKKFLDVSDYARPFALKLVKILLLTSIGSYAVTFTFLLVGLIAAWFIYSNSSPIIIALLIFTKSMLDAVDGEIARQRNEPSMVGRYLDSFFDFIINLSLFWSITLYFNQSLWLMVASLLMYQLQGSIFNYYYLVKRYQVNGDKTSRIFEKELPAPYERDNPTLLKILHKTYLIVYAWQDYLIFRLDKNAINTQELPGWFLTLVSFLGLGFQLLIIAVFIIFNIHQYVLIFFLIPYSVFGLVVIIIRKIFVK